ncbi:hypothetical protein [uncultured Lacinutrix sp.]|uniref:hypothetical protein n=1 Tax=uncultured Lacinutrix sp. TaxID=574032 RepID=UPI002637AED8|nr:hypothetical protein [uncultured Lacinutrix sp.]
MKNKLIVKIVTLVIVIINIASVLFLDFFISQLVRLALSALFLILFLFLKTRNKLYLVFLVFMVIADIVDLYYTKPYITEIYSLIKMIAFSLLAFSVLKKIKIQKLEYKVVILFSVVVGINLLIAYKLVSETSNLLYNNIERIAMFANWIVSISVAAVAAKYYFDSESKKAFYFMCFTFLFIFTDLCGFISNSFGMHLFLYLERILYFLAYMYLSFYLCFTEENKDDVLELF